MKIYKIRGDGSLEPVRVSQNCLPELYRLNNVPNDPYSRAKFLHSKIFDRSQAELDKLEGKVSEGRLNWETIAVTLETIFTLHYPKLTSPLKRH